MMLKRATEHLVSELSMDPQLSISWHLDQLTDNDIKDLMNIYLNARKAMIHTIVVSKKVLTKECATIDAFINSLKAELDRRDKIR
jgi:hypothetical protein